MIQIGMIIGDRYEILDRIGTGGMSDVYKAKDHKLNRSVAIKVLKAEFADNTEFVSKFRVEAQAAAGLSHPNIVNVYDVGVDHGNYFIVMELVEGITLKNYIEKKSRLSVKEAISIAIQVSMGLEAAHNNHIIHRDIKPQNIMISRDGKVKVTDFGIAKAATGDTISVNAMGSVHYISPEQVKGFVTDEKSDIYSTGITMFEMLTGKVPFNADTTVAIAFMQINEKLPSIRALVPEVPLGLEQIIEKCTRKNPERRYRNMSALIADLKQVLRDPNVVFVRESVREPETEVKPELPKEQAVPVKEPKVKPEPVRKEAEKQPQKAPRKRVRKDPYEGLTPEEKHRKIIGSHLDLEKDYDGYETLQERITNLIMAVTAILIAGAVFFFAGNALGLFDGDLFNRNGSSVKVTMPFVTGETKISAEESVKKLGLDVVLDYVNSDTYDEGIVISAETEDGVAIRSGEKIAQGTKIVLKVSAGAEGAAVPAVLGMPIAEATTALNKEGFYPTKIYNFSSEYEKDVVYYQTPDAGTVMERGSEVTLYVSKGIEIVKVDMPKITGKSVEEATSILAELGLEIQVEAEKRFSEEYPVDTICYQSYGQGASVNVGSVVVAYISKGTEMTPTFFRYDLNCPADYVAPYSITIEIMDASGTLIDTQHATEFPYHMDIGFMGKSTRGTMRLTYYANVPVQTTDDSGNTITKNEIQVINTTQSITFTKE